MSYWKQDQPREPGWYWWKRIKKDAPEVVHVREAGVAFTAGWGTQSDPEKLKGWWWSEVIHPPVKTE